MAYTRSAGLHGGRAFSWAAIVLGLLTTVAGAGCTPPRGEGCSRGSERCSCLNSGACETGLVCLSGLCVVGTAPAADAGTGAAPPDLAPASVDVGAGAAVEAAVEATAIEVTSARPEILLPTLAEAGAPRDVPPEAPPMTQPQPGIGGLLPPNGRFVLHPRRVDNMVTLVPDGWTAKAGPATGVLEFRPSAPGDLEYIAVEQKEIAMSEAACGRAVRAVIMLEPTARVRDRIHPREDATLEAWAFGDAPGIFAVFACHIDLLPNQRALMTEAVMIGKSYEVLDQVHAAFLLRTIAGATVPATPAPSFDGEWFFTTSVLGQSRFVVIKIANKEFALGIGSESAMPAPLVHLNLTTGSYQQEGGVLSLVHASCTRQIGDPNAAQPSITEPCALEDVPLGLTATINGAGALVLTGLPLSYRMAGEELVRERVVLQK